MRRFLHLRSQALRGRPGGEAIEVLETAFGVVKLLAPRVFPDERGFFFESYNEREFFELGISERFVQDNHSTSYKGVLRGLHYQLPHAQGKLIRVLQGCIHDVAVDLRKSSPTFGQWVGYELSESNQRLLWIPTGFAHGFLTISNKAAVAYKATDFYAAESERCILWNDPDLAIRWPLEKVVPKLSKKDDEGKFLKQADVFP